MFGLRHRLDDPHFHPRGRPPFRQIVDGAGPVLAEAEILADPKSLHPEAGQIAVHELMRRHGTETWRESLNHHAIDAHAPQ